MRCYANLLSDGHIVSGPWCILLVRQHTCRFRLCMTADQRPPHRDRLALSGRACYLMQRLAPGCKARRGMPFTGGSVVCSEPLITCSTMWVLLFAGSPTCRLPATTTECSLHEDYSKLFRGCKQFVPSAFTCVRCLHSTMTPVSVCTADITSHGLYATRK